ncbi:MAG: SWIM zinc finger family protein [Anaerolineae bacterium]|nr:SWIM zinc finger family protein [Anaerolineae bacterium]
MKPTQLKSLQSKSKQLEVRMIYPERQGEPFRAVVESNEPLSHTVTIRFHPDGGIETECTCAWAQHGGVGCSHVMAVLNRLAARKHSSLSFWATPEEARKQKRRVFKLTRARGRESLWVTSRRPV